MAALAWRESNLRERAQAASYVSDVQLSFARLEQGRRGLAQASLERTPPQYRGWEWGYLAREAGLGNADSGSAPVELRTGETAAEIWRNAVPTVVATLPGKRGLGFGQVLFSADGRTLISRTPGTPGTVVWDVESGEAIRTLSEAGAVALSHDGSWLLTFERGASTNPSAPSNLAVLRNFETGAPVRTFKSPGGGLSLASLDRHSALTTR